MGADADAAVLYSGHYGHPGYYGYGSYGQGYRGYYGGPYRYGGLGHYRYGYGFHGARFHHFGKRSADAKPEADAAAAGDAYFRYFGHEYDHGYGHGYGHYYEEECGYPTCAPSYAYGTYRHFSKRSADA